MSCGTCVMYHDAYARRGFTALRSTVSRYTLFVDALEQSPLRYLVPLVTSPAASENEILRVHAPEYVDLVQEMDLAGRGRLDLSTPAWHGMYERAARIVGGSVRAVDLIATGEAAHVFNPAGGQHHAHHGRGGGFCVFNDVVAAVRRFQDWGLGRIAVVDVDGHHGDGTESLLEREPILTVSTHQFGERTYPGTGASETVGCGAGIGFAVNVPLARGTGDSAYLQIFRRTVEPVLHAYRPDALILEFGTDGHAADPLLRLRLSSRAYREIARRIHALAHELCAGRLLVVGGGGYAPQHVVGCWVSMLGELVGVDAHGAHPASAEWPGEPHIAPDAAADALSLQAAMKTREAVFPFFGLDAASSAHA